jgi:prepilin-type processing-associated H-X9-DG protein
VEKPFNANVAPASPLGLNGAQTLTVSANLWLLCRADFAQPEIFICPSSEKAGNKANLRDTDGTAGGVGPEYFVDFPFGGAGIITTGATAIAYSFVQPWTLWAGSSGSWDMWAADMNPRIIIGGDENSGGASVGYMPNDSNLSQLPTFQQMKDSINSKNHTGDGQNFLYGDGHATWSKSAFAGVAADNAYTRRDASASARMSVKPADNTNDQWDSVLIPASNAALAGWTLLVN